MMKDVQSEKDQRRVALKYVGVDEIRWPLQLRDKQRGVQHTVAKVRLAVDLPQDTRGTHMSRFVECLQELEYLELGQEERVLDLLKEHLQAESAMMRLEFPYFLQKAAPVSGKVAPMDIDCVFTAEKRDKFSLKVRADIPIQTLCPCSKEISERGAHNQRAVARMEVLAGEMVWLEELAEMADRQELVSPRTRYASEWVWASMKPGVTRQPVASIRSASGAEISPMAAILSPSTSTSARRTAAPIPSITVPLAISVFIPYSCRFPSF